jgi:hypothetical protein
MTHYILKALAKADMTRDGTDFLLHMNTDRGAIELALNAGQLGVLINALRSIERSAAKLDVAPGQAAMEQMQMEVVDRVQGGCGVVNDAHNMVLVFNTEELSQAYAFDLKRTTTLARIVARELKNLKALASHKGRGIA